MLAAARSLETAAESADRFHLVLSSVVPVAELRAWFEGAGAGHVAVYATGADLPRDTDTVRQVTAWKDAGLAVTHQERDAADRRRWSFIVRKGPPNAEPARRAPTRVRMPEGAREVLDELRAAAERGQPCPSNAALGRDALGLHGPAARNRAKYLVEWLDDHGQIAVTPGSATVQRVVRILAVGRAQGRETGR